MTKSAAQSPPDRSADFERFRREYWEFGFEGWDCEEEADAVLARFRFTLNGEPAFSPTLRLPLSTNLRAEQGTLLDNLFFHIGLIEAISYWKAYCPPVLSVRCGSLQPSQVLFLGDLFYNGLGEFRYLNGLTQDKNAFVPEIQSDGPVREISSGPENRSETCLVPLGGGKDSAVVLSLLQAQGQSLWPMFLNADPAAERVAETLAIPRETWVSVRRTICPELLKRNADGALNGHTPFSALLAFIATGYAALQGIPHVVLANESSANEATVPGTMINHQYSKSWHFEEQFARYFKEHLHAGTHYFSLLRPWNEAQIAREFARHPKLLTAFRSCNVGSKQDRWCCQCPKCLFVFVMLAGFVPREKLIEAFGANLLDDPELYPTMLSLAGFDENKPFECVGSMEEVVAALVHAKPAYEDSALMQRFFAEHGAALEGRRPIADLLQEWNPEHGIPEVFAKVLPRLDL